MREGRVWPAYLRLSPRELAARAEALRGLASPCRLCPRECRARRAEGERGSCRAGLAPWVSSFGPHFGEEGVLVGRGGSGTIFLAGCNLHCTYCDTPYARQTAGHPTTVAKLLRALLRIRLRQRFKAI